MRKLYIYLAAMLLIATVTQAQTRFVNGSTGSNANAGTSAGTAWATIQYAIDNSAPGTTIEVAAGTYSENLVVNKSLTLVGPNTSFEGFASRFPEATITRASSDAADGNIITVTANNVTIRGFEFDGNLNFDAARGIATGTDASSWPNNVANLDVINNIFRDLSTGLKVQGNFASATTGHQVEGNLFEDHTKSAGIFYTFLVSEVNTGVAFVNSAYATISNNEFNRVFSGIITRNMGGSGSGSISGNTIRVSSVNGATPLFGAGIANIRHYSGSYPVSNNTVTRAVGETDPSFYGLYTLRVVGDAVSYTGNTLTGPGTNITNTSLAYADATTLSAVPATEISSAHYLWGCTPSGGDTITVSNETVTAFNFGINIVDRADSTNGAGGSGQIQPTFNVGYKVDGADVSLCHQFALAVYQQANFNPTTWPAAVAYTNHVNVTNSSFTENVGGRTDRAAIGLQNFAVSGTGSMTDIDRSTIFFRLSNSTVSNNRRYGINSRAARSIKISNCVFEGNGWNPGANSRGGNFGLVTTSGGTFRTMGGLIEVNNSIFNRASSTRDGAFTTSGLRATNFVIQAQTGRVDGTAVMPATFSLPFVNFFRNSVVGYTATGNNGGFIDATLAADHRLNASFCWWGTTVDSEINTSTVNNVVDYTPYLGAGTDGSPAIGFQPSSTTYHVSNNRGQAGAFGQPTVNGGAITGITVQAPGYSYTTAPVVTITSGGGTGASFNANLTAGRVSSFSQVSGGTNYGTGSARRPIITIAGPDRLQEALDALPATGGTLVLPGATYAGTISTTKSFTLQTTGTAVISGSLTSTGNVTLNNATVSITGTLSLGGSGIFNLNTGRLTLANNVAGNPARLQSTGGSILEVGNGVTTLPINVTDLQKLVKTGASTLALSSNLNVDTVTVGAGTIDITGRSLTVFNQYSGAGLLAGNHLSNLSVSGASASTVNFASGAQLRNLTVGSTAGLTLGSNAVTVFGTVQLVGASTLATANLLTLGHSETLGNGHLGVMPAGSSIVGNVNVHHNYAGQINQFRWVFTGANVNGRTLNDWDGSAPDVNFNYTSAPPVQPSVFNFNNSTGAWAAATTGTQSITPGVGVRIFVPQTFLDSDQSGNGNGVLSLSGSPVYGDGAGSAAGTFTFPGVVNAADGWNFVANPYPAALDWENAGWTKTNIDSTFYTWELFRYGSYNATLGIALNGGNRIIGKGQGFFVRATGTPTLAVTEGAKAATQRYIARQGNNAGLSLLRLEMRNAASTDRDEIAIGFLAGATAGIDAGLDATKLSGSNFNISSLNGSTALAMNINGLLTAQTIVPLRVSGNNGTYSLNFTELNNFAAGTQIMLVDKFLNVTQDITLNPAYPFSITANALSKGDNRFEIVFAPALVSVSNLLAKPQVSVYPNPAVAGAAVTVSLAGFKAGEQGTLMVVDSKGALVSTTSFTTAETLTLNSVASNLAAGVYSIRISTNSHAITQKLVINN